MQFGQQTELSKQKSLSERLKRIPCIGHFVPVFTALLILLSGCASKPELPPAREPEPDTSVTKTLFTEPDFPQLIQSVENKHGPIAGNRIRHWATLVERGKSLKTYEQLVETNRFFNGAQFLTDQEVWQTDDYWATPIEFLIKDAGDCEEFAIAKYITLRYMGLEDQKMRITYVKALTLNQAHMVLGYYSEPSQIPLVLDNLNPRILPANERDDLVPVYSFNSADLWLAKSDKDQKTRSELQAVENLRPWQSLLQKLRGDR